MFMVVVTGVLLIVAGIAMLLMPNMTRKLDRLDNSLRGRQSYQGDAYEVGRVLRAVVFIGAGIAILMLPTLL